MMLPRSINVTYLIWKIIVVYYQQDLQLFEKPPDHENIVFCFYFSGMTQRRSTEV